MESGVDPADRTTLDLSTARWSFCPREHVPAKSVVPVDHASLWDWIDVEGPGDVLVLLRNLGRISDPYQAQNDLACRWVENLDWAFRVLFQINSDFIQSENDISLILKDLDCFAQVVLNGFHVGLTANQFREYRFSVEELLVEGTNELIIYLRSQKRIAAALEAAYGQLPSGFDTPRVYARRCQCWTGWDWAARLSSAGVLCAPRLEIEPRTRLESPFVYVRDLPPTAPGDATAPHATLVLEVDIVSQTKAKGTLFARIYDPDGEPVAEGQTTIRTGIGQSTARLSLRMENPRLWWPIGMGGQPLYRAEFHLEATDRLGLELSSAASCRFAVRTAAVARTSDTEGESFIPHINGVPVFCRGTNWIPTRMLPGDARDDDYRLLISAAAAAGMNCLRVWGGGVYERDLFYDLCDEAGILVWQDFMFACAAYPVHKEFTDEVELEADWQIKRLRNHPCLFLWCGNNENEWLHQIGELRLAREARIIGEPIWSTLLKRKCEDLDPSRPYHQSSPFGRNRSDYNDEHSGDRHNWECWSRWQSPDVYLRDEGRFLSEFGFQSIPDLESVRRFAPNATSLDDPDLLHHQKMVQGQERLTRYAAEMFRLPTRFEDWIELTQRLQAEILRRGVEHWRRRKFATAGTLIWQHHDAYPAISWSLIDFYRRPKLAWRAARRFFSPVLLSVALINDGSEVGAFPPPGRQTPQEEPPPDFPVGREPIAEPAPISCALPVHLLQAVLINDTPHRLSGIVTLSSHSSADGAEIGRFTATVTCPPNCNSEPVQIQPEVLQITDYARTFVRARFEPDDITATALRQVSALFEAACERLQEDTPMPPLFSAPDFSPALASDVLLVEPRFFDWGEGVTIFGQNRPAWH